MFAETDRQMKEVKELIGGIGNKQFCEKSLHYKLNSRNFSIFSLR
jgi:hypothetical protein